MDNTVYLNHSATEDFLVTHFRKLREIMEADDCRNAGVLPVPDTFPVSLHSGEDLKSYDQHQKVVAIPKAKSKQAMAVLRVREFLLAVTSVSFAAFEAEFASQGFQIQMLWGVTTPSMSMTMDMLRKVAGETNPLMDNDIAGQMEITGLELLLVPTVYLERSANGL
ncbi:MAG: hypothetical protein DI628_00005 [Blastochloris viridis]|uniref:Uncharacterized protein n=1 Tax=Blastochloris viridis TaxID=1079 RepID=A0A6N4RAE2_BLAVI|nr:MAG: hypothetical protein DI628_00005 [Blastochloris viridis]